MYYQDIIDTILDNSAQEVKRIKDAVKTECAAIKESADAEVKAIKSRAQMDAKAMRAETLARRLTVADLDVKKVLLNAKQEIIDSVYETAKAKLKSLSTKDYKALVEGMIAMGAKDGDVVAVGTRDKKTITAAFVKGVAGKLGIKLSVVYDDGIDGGVIIKSPDCDSNMTIDLEVASIKVATETEVSKRLF